MTDAAICRRALQKVGNKTPITDPETDNTSAARECVKAYDAVRLAALRRHPWNFATDRASLAALATAPAWGFANQYNWPEDALRIVRVQDDELGIKWVVEGRKILTDFGAPLNISYIKDVTDSAQFDSQFAELFAHLLAIELVEPLAQSNTKKKELREDLRGLLPSATLTDALEATPEELPEDSWIQSRA